MKLLKGILPKFGVAKGLAPDSRSGRTEEHAWERWGWIWHVAFYMFLIVSLMSSLADLGLYGRPQVAIISLSLIFGVWYWIMFIRAGWLEGTRPAIVYLVVAFVLWFALASLHPAYHMLLFMVYNQIYAALPIRLAIPGSAILTILILARNLVQDPESAFVWILIGIFSIAFGSLFGLWIDSIIKQSQKRQQLIEELEETRKELANEERRAGMLEERGRLAREIHDTLAQGFISIVTHLEVAEEELPPGSKSAARHLDQARRTARDNLVEARRLVAALQPEILESSSLPEALERISARWTEKTGVSAEVEITGDYEHLPQELQVTLLRVAQEALSNVRKHAEAHQVTLTLSYLEDLVVLDIQDDGIGFSPGATTNGAEGGFGLRAMRERVEQLGGRLLVESTPREGTTLAVQVPLEVRTETIQGSDRRP